MNFYGGNAFAASAPTFNPGAYDFGLGGLGSKIGGEASGGKSGGFLGGMIDPLSLGLGAANIGVSIWQGIIQRNAANRSLDMQTNFANAKMAAARDRLYNEIDMAQKGAMFAEGSKIGDRVAAYGYGADLNLGRAIDAKRLELGEFADRQFGNRMRDAVANRGFELSGATQQMYDKASRRKMKEALTQQLAAGRGMFGPIAPINVDSMVI